MKRYLFLSLLLLGFSVQAQKGTDQFSTDACTCFQSIKLEATTASAIEEAIGQCMETSLTANKKELKKNGIVDWDKGATEEQVTNLWEIIFSKCRPAAEVVFGKMKELKEAQLNTSFVGVVTYKQDIALSGMMKKMGMTKEKMLEELNKEGKWADSLFTFYRLGNYAFIGNNKNQTQRIYLADENTIYSFSTVGDGICSVQEAVDLDLNGAPDKPAITELDTTVMIMNLPCKAIRMKWKLGEYDYYYHPSQLNANPDLFKQHTSEGLAQFVAMSKCLPMQIVKNTMGMKVIQTAVAIEPGDFDTRYFAIPELVEDASLNILKLPGIKMMRIKE